MGSLPEASLLLHEGFSSQMLGLPHSMEAVFIKAHSRLEYPKNKIKATVLLRPELECPSCCILSVKAVTGPAQDRSGGGHSPLLDVKSGMHIEGRD